MNMIKVLTLSLILGLSFGLSSCNDRPRPPAQGEPAAPAPDKDKPALFSTKSPADNSELIPAYVPDAQVAMEGMSPDWAKSLIIASLRIETATELGTFDAAIRLLDHYAEMGVNALWIAPIFDRKTDPAAVEGFANGNGYGNFGPDTVYPKLTGTASTEESYKVIRRFVDAAHKRNIRVLFDIISWGVDKNSPIIQEHPDFWIRLEDNQYREAYGGYLYDWSKPEVREWFNDKAVRFIEETNADGFRVDLAPDTSGYYLKEVRDQLYRKGRKILLVSEMPSEPKETFDFAQLGVNGWTEPPAYSPPEKFEEQKKRFGSMHDSTFVFRTNVVDAIRTGSGIGLPQLQQKGEGGLFRYYAASPLFHDGHAPFVQANRVRFGYLALLPFIPIWWIGEEWNNPHDSPQVMYFNKIDWKAKATPENSAFFEDVKRILRVRRFFPEIFEKFSPSLRDANIAKVDSTRDGEPNPLQAYLRYAGDKAVLVVPNYESKAPVSTFRIRPFSPEWGQDKTGNARLTNLMTGEVIARKPWADLAEFEATIEANRLGLFLIEND